METEQVLADKAQVRAGEWVVASLLAKASAGWGPVVEKDADKEKGWEWAAAKVKATAVAAVCVAGRDPNISNSCFQKS